MNRHAQSTVPLTTNGVQPPAYDMLEWLWRSGQVNKRHPIGPEGRCLTCGDCKIGHWQWIGEAPE